MGLIPIVCIGETLDQREANQTLDVLDRQIKDGLDAITGDQVAALVWPTSPSGPSAPAATPRPQQAGEAHAHIRVAHPPVVRAPTRPTVRILYGGS